MTHIIIALKENETLDAGQLNEEIAVLGAPFIGSHNAREAIVDCDAADEVAIRNIITAHLAGTAVREHNKPILAAIAAIERDPKQGEGIIRTLREFYLDKVKADHPKKPQIAAAEAAITAERNKLQ